MPLEKIVKEENWAWGLWKITETEIELKAMIRQDEPVPGAISNGQKRLESIAGRVLTRRLLDEFGQKYEGLVKNEHGKPYLRNSRYQISLSHSFPYVAVILHLEKPVGIDLEQPKEKLLRVAPRVLSATERADAGDIIVKHCIYWCAKETLIKIYGKKDLVLAENLQIKPFPLASEGHILGKIIVSDIERLIPLYYQVFPGFVLVFNRNSSERP